MSEDVSMDEELEALLSDLQEDEPEEENESELDDIEPSEVETAGPLNIVSDTAPMLGPEMSDPAEDIEEVEPPNLPIEQSVASIANLQEVIGKFDHDYDEVQTNLKRDRGRIDTVIDLLLQRVRNNADAETDTMSLVKALGVLADTNGHAVKLLDSRSKLLSATKTVVNANQTNVNITGVDPELQNILAQPPEEDE
jgi:hypothetical protein